MAQQPQDRASFSVDGVSTFVDELPVELQQLFSQVVWLRGKREEAALPHMAMQRAVEHAEVQLVSKVREVRSASVEARSEVVQLDSTPV